MSGDLKLYRVTLEYEVYALAKDECEAIYEAKSGIEDDGMEPDLEFASEVSGRKGISSNWINMTPFGGDGDMSVGEWLNRPPEVTSEAEAPAYADTQTMPLPFPAPATGEKAP